MKATLKIKQEDNNRSVFHITMMDCNLSNYQYTGIRNQLLDYRTGMHHQRSLSLRQRFKACNERVP